jgi:hypothetical protein
MGGTTPQWSHMQSDGSQSDLHTGHEVSHFTAWYWLVLLLSRGYQPKLDFSNSYPARRKNIFIPIPIVTTHISYESWTFAFIIIIKC